MRCISGDAPLSIAVSDVTENPKSGKNPDQRSDAREHFWLHKIPAEVSKQVASSKLGVADLESEKELDERW